MNDHDKKSARDESPTVNSIQRIQQLVDTLKSEGSDLLFIYAALAQVTAELELEATAWLNEHKQPIAELSTVIHSELYRAALAELDPALLAAALRLLADGNKCASPYVVKRT